MQDRIHGTTMPVLEMVLDPGESIKSESAELSWMTQSIQMSTSTGGGGVKGLFKRVVGGGSFFMTQYTAAGGPGSVSFAAKLPGAIFPIEVSQSPGGSWLAHRHAYVCSTSEVQLGVGLQQRLGAGIFGGNGFLLQKIHGDGRAWVEMSGEVITFDLEPGETLRVHPGHVGLFHDTVTFNITTVPGIKNKVFGGDGIFLASLTGPGRVYLQSLPIARLAHALAEYLPGEAGNQKAAASGLGGFAVGSILNDVLGGND